MIIHATIDTDNHTVIAETESMAPSWAPYLKKNLQVEIKDAQWDNITLRNLILFMLNARRKHGEIKFPISY